MANDTFPFFVNAVVNIPFSLIITLGNSLILVSFARTPSLLSPSNVLLVGLAVSDLCVGLIIQPVYIAWKCNLHFSLTPTKSAAILEKVFSFSSQLLTSLSFLIVSSLSIDKFLAIHLHLRYQQIVTVNRVARFLFLLWLFSIFISLLDVWRPRIFGRISVTVVCLCFLVNVVLYFKIYRVVRRHQIQISHQLTSPVATETINRTARLKSSFFTTLCLYLIFNLCYIPYLCIAVGISVVDKYVGKEAVAKLFLPFEVSWTVVYINSLLNPLIFSWRITDIRTAVKSTLNYISTKPSCFSE